MRLLLFACLLLTSAANAQLSHVQWSFTLADPEIKLNKENLLILSAHLPEGWGIFGSNFHASSFGDEPTTFEFAPSVDYVLHDPAISINPLHVDYEMLCIHYTYFESKAEFRQCIRFTAYPESIQGKITGCLVNLKSGQKVPFDEPINLPIDHVTAAR